MRLEVKVHEFRMDDTVVDDQPGLAIPTSVGDIESGAVIC